MGGIMKNDGDERIEIVAHVWNKKKEITESSKMPLAFDFATDSESFYPEIAISGGNLPDTIWVDLRDLRRVIAAMNDWARRIKKPNWSDL